MRKAQARTQAQQRDATRLSHSIVFRIEPMACDELAHTGPMNIGSSKGI
jgi:hypothetical protein